MAVTAAAVGVMVALATNTPAFAAPVGTGATPGPGSAAPVSITDLAGAVPLVGGGWSISTVGPDRVENNVMPYDRVLDVAGYSLADRGRVHMWDYRDTGNVQNQRWNIVDTGGHYYQIINRNSGKCLDKSMDFGNVDGELVYQYTCSASHPANQIWYFSSGPNGYELIRSRADGRCLDIKNSVDADDATVQVWSCNFSSWNQTWYTTQE